MPDFNPDKERHRRHKFIVQQAFPEALGSDVMTSRGALKPDHMGRMVVKDESLAREIQQENPRELVVTRMKHDHPADRGHNYFFTVPEMPWKRQHRDTEVQETQKRQDESPGEAQDESVDTKD